MVSSREMRSPLLPSSLYTSGAFSALAKANGAHAGVMPAAETPLRRARGSASRFLIPAAGEKPKIELYSPEFYAACTIGGILSCGLTHMAVTPLDLVKCNMQVRAGTIPLPER